MTLLIVQALNGIQLGMLLFLIAAGLTLVFGVPLFLTLVAPGALGPDWALAAFPFMVIAE